MALIITDPLGSSWRIPSSEESGDISDYVHTISPLYILICMALIITDPLGSSWSIMSNLYLSGYLLYRIVPFYSLFWMTLIITDL